MGSDLGVTLPLAEGEQTIATLGRFVPLGVLGRGGMGVVLRARDPELDREVAIKVLTSMTADATLRLQREAQAMAKLSHPNVVTVYEIGQVGEGRFLAMELVEGTTLRQWLQPARPWREIVAAFVACGRGLAAAHAAGLVHRDFKPENVLIGGDGRPRVTDFGLAGIESAVAGTPGYMAPEQWLGEDTDARTDVFAFCVALWEALYKQRPFGDDVAETRSGNPGTRDELRARVLGGHIQEPGDHAVDAKVEGLLRRGLARDRADRWPSLAPLLAELDRKPSRRWPWLAGGAAGVAVIAAVLVLARSNEPVDPCPDPEAQLASIWDAGVEAKLRAAFASVAPAFANDASDRVVARLDRYAKQWRDGTIAACRATRIDGTQSAELLDRRSVCLERRRGELAALTASLLKADRKRVSTAVEATGALGDIDQCGNTELLLAFAPPTDPELRRKVEALEGEIDANFASEGRVVSAERQAKAVELVEKARALTYLPALVHALAEAQDAASDNSDQIANEKYLRELAQRSAEAHDDGRAARAWVDLGRLLAESRRIAEAKTLEPFAAAAVSRAGSPPQLRYVQLASVGVRKLYEQDYPGAIAAFEASAKAADTDERRAPVELMLSQVIYLKDGPKAALPLAEASARFSEQAYGKHHPQTAKAKHMIAQYLTETRDQDRAAKLELEVIALREEIYGPNHREVATALHILGNIERERRNYPAARKAYERAVAIFESDRGGLDAGLSRGPLAAVIADTDGIDAAKPMFRHALEELAAGGKDKTSYIAVEVDYSYRLLDAKLCVEAIPLLDHAISVLPALRVRQLPQVLEASAHCDLEAKRFDVALAKLERARTLCTEVQCPAGVIPIVAFKLGRLLLERGPDRARGRALVEEARKEAIEDDDKDLLSDIEHWEAKRK